mmetsp:Transcript_49012/g.163594  ORF Transcript_49012/g.163594 Transcript_49012/m.163594 type:complete len:213 (-) Transcript_49012:727-1365(-)
MKPGEGGEELGDIWLLDTTRQALAWACVAQPATLPPGPRPLQRCHAATRVGSSILFFGGGRSHTLTNGISRFDTEAMAWAAPPALSGPLPSRRQNAAMELLPSTGAVVVFGGWKMGAMGQDVLLGDTYVLDLDAPQVHPPSPSSARERASRAWTGRGPRPVGHAGARTRWRTRVAAAATPQRGRWAWLAAGWCVAALPVLARVAHSGLRCLW